MTNMDVDPAGLLGTLKKSTEQLPPSAPRTDSTPIRNYPTDMITRLGHDDALATALLETRRRDGLPRDRAARRGVCDRAEIELVQRG